MARVVQCVGICGSARRPSKSRTLIQAVTDGIERLYGVTCQTFDMLDIQPELGQTISREHATGPLLHSLQLVENAEIIVVGSPVYQGSYSGLFKHFVDFLDPGRMSGKKIIITATGGGDRHALVVEHQLRPLFGFFSAHTIATAVYASDRHFADSQLASQEIFKRIESATRELHPWLQHES